jgi:hypothetical protein
VVYTNGSPVFEAAESAPADFLVAAYKHLGMQYPKFYKMDNLSKLGIIASEALLKQGFAQPGYAPADIGVVLSNASSSLDTDMKYFQTVGNIASPALFVYTLPNIMIGEICIRNGFKGENAFFVFDRFDADFTKKYVSNLLDTDVLEVCICGWVELLEGVYNAVLFLVEKKDDVKQDMLFTIENINKIYQLENG